MAKWDLEVASFDHYPFSHDWDPVRKLFSITNVRDPMLLLFLSLSLFHFFLLFVFFEVCRLLLEGFSICKPVLGSSKEFFT